MEARHDPGHQHLAPPARPRRHDRQVQPSREVAQGWVTQAKVTHTKVLTKPAANTRTKPRSKWPEVQVSTEL